MENMLTPYQSYVGSDDKYIGLYQEFCALNQHIADARLQSCETEARIKDAIQRLQIEENDNFNQLEMQVTSSERNLHNNIVEVRVDALKAETRLADRITNFERSTDEKFCNIKGEIKDSTRLILDRLTSDKIDEKNDEIAELRACNRAKGQELLFSNQQNKLESMINSIAQEQKFSSKLTQFGVGNVAIPTQTANQG